MTAHHTPSLVKGAFYAIACYLCVALMSVCSKIASQNVSILTIVFFQNAICFLINLPKVLKHGVKGLKTEHPYLHFTRDLAGLLSFSFLFFSIQTIPLANAVLLQNTAPLWIPFIIWIWFKKKVPSHLWYSILIGFLGVIFILKPSSKIIDLHSLMGLFSGIFLAISLLAIRRLAATEPMPRVLFYYFLLGTLFSAPFAAKEIIPSLSGMVFFPLLGVALFFFLAQVFITLAFGHSKASTLSPLSYSAVLFSAIFDGVIWGKIPDIWSAIGMILVILGGISAVYLEKKYEKKYIM